MVTEQTLQHLERLLAQTTPGIWAPMTQQIMVLPDNCEKPYHYGFDPRENQADIDFICAARRDLPKLIAAIRELREHLSPKVSP